MVREIPPILDARPIDPEHFHRVAKDPKVDDDTAALLRRMHKVRCARQRQWDKDNPLPAQSKDAKPARKKRNPPVRWDPGDVFPMWLPMYEDTSYAVLAAVARYWALCDDQVAAGCGAPFESHRDLLLRVDIELQHHILSKWHPSDMDDFA